MTPEIQRILDVVGPDNWPEIGPKLFEAIVSAGLDHVTTDRVLKEAAERAGATLTTVRKDFAVYLGPGQEQSNKTAAKLVRLALDGAEYWHDAERTAWATLRVDGHLEHWPVRSRAFRLWLGNLYYRAEGKPPNSQATQDALIALEGRAVFEGAEHPTYLRVAHRDGDVWLDLGRPDWQAVRITRDGWRLVPSHEAPRFRRSKATGSLPNPKTGRGLKAILEPWELDGGQIALLGAYLLGTLSAGPYPVLALSGEQGSGKSTLARFLRGLVDPGGDLVSLPRESRDLFVCARNSHVLAFDNVSGIPPWLSDDLCKLATGGTLRLRELYTNDEEVFLEARRPVILNGITDFITRQDLLDRAILVHLSPIARYTPEAALWDAYRAHHPEALGELLDLVALALRELPRTRAPNVRMADFARWALAAEAGYTAPGTFLAAFEGMRADAVLVALDSEPLYAHLLTLLDAGPFEGSASELLEALNAARGEGRPPEGWPRTAHGLASWLKRLAPALRKVGVDVSPLPRNKHKRGWQLRKVEGTNVTNVINVINPVQDVIPRVTFIPPGDISNVTPPQQMSPREYRPGRNGDVDDVGDISTPDSSDLEDEGGDIAWF